MILPFLFLLEEAYVFYLELNSENASLTPQEL